MSPSSLRIRCHTLDEARLIVSLLLSRKVSPSNIQVLSAEPIHDVGETLSGQSRLPAFVLTGAFVGAVSGYAMAAITAGLYPLNTGGMPIVAQLPVGIVTYEAMMLLAVLFALGGLLLEAKLLRKRPADFDVHAQVIVDGEVHVLARVASEEEAEGLRIAVDAGRYGSET